MYQASTAFRQAIDNNTRGKLHSRFVINNEPISLNYKNYTLSHKLMAAAEFGNAAAALLEINLASPSSGLEGTEIHLQVGMELGNAIEWVPMGKFVVMKVTDSQILANDVLIKTNVNFKSEIEYPATIPQILSEVSQKCGVVFSANTYPDVVITSPFDATTANDMIRQIAFILGKNVKATRTGEIEFVWTNSSSASIGKNKHFKCETNTSDLTVTALICTVGDKKLMAGTEGYAISFSTPYMTEAELVAMLPTRVVSFRGGSVEFIGDPCVDTGDQLSVVNNAGQIVNFFVMENTFYFDGGCKNNVTSFADTEKQSEYKRSSTITERFFDMQKTVDGVVIDVGVAVDGVVAMKSQVDINSSSIATTVSDLGSVKNAFDGFKNDTGDNLANLTDYISKVEQNAKSVDFEFSEYKSVNDWQVLANTNAINEYKTNIQLSNDGITIGKSSSQFNSKFTETKLSFRQGETELAYIDKDGLSVPENATIGKRLNVGEYAWIFRENGHFGLVKV